jgi:hypothetical protein
MTTAIHPITWKQRAQVRERNGFRYRRITSTCGRYAVELSTYLDNRAIYERTLATTGSKQKARAAMLSDVWRALVADGDGWTVISRHRKQARAEAACENHSRRNDP